MNARVSSLLTRWLLGVLLLTALILKLEQLVEGGGWSRRWIEEGVIGGEAVWALWLFRGKWTRLGLCLSVIGFLCFAGASWWKLSKGITGCGCFGRWDLSPKVSFWIDWAAVVLLGWSYGMEFSEPKRRHRFWLSAAVLSLLVAIGFYQTALFFGRNSEVDPQDWIGHSWPPIEDPRFSVDLASGNWVVLVYDSSCHHCMTLAEDYLEQAKTWRAEGRQVELSLIDIASSPDAERTPDALTRTKRSEEQNRIFKPIPAVLLVKNGRILAVQEGWFSGGSELKILR